MDMQYDLSIAFARLDACAVGFPEIWTRLCHGFLSAVFPTNSIVRTDREKFGFDILDQTAGVAYYCQAVERPDEDALSVNDTIAAFERAVHNREERKWKLFNVASNAEYSDEAMGVFKGRMHTLGVAPEEVGFIGPATWNRLCSEYPRVVEDWFDYRVTVSKDAVKKAFEEARYYPKYVAQYSALVEDAEFHVLLTNNRTPLQLLLPFSPQLTVRELLEVGQVLFDLSLEATDFRDLGTSARLSLSVVIDGVQQGFKTKLEDMLHSGGEAQLWIQIVWEEKSFEQVRPDDGMPLRDALLPAAARRFAYMRYDTVVAHMETSALFLNQTFAWMPSQVTKASPKEETLARKAAVVSARIWQKAARLLPPVRKILSAFGRRVPVRLGASAPRSAKAGSSFTARFVAYHPDLEVDMTRQLTEWGPTSAHRLDAARANWKLGTQVWVRAYGEDLIVDPQVDEFCWQGEKHILDYRVNVSEKATGGRDLKFDVYIEDFRIARVWLPLEIGQDATGKPYTQTISSPRTAFASYASEDRPRVLDRVAALEIHCGLQVFLDCVSMRPNARWRELLPEMVLESDQLLLFWSKAARDSEWVDREWRLAFGRTGIEGIEIHPLAPYDEAKLPQELADLAHGADPLMVIRAHEAELRTGNAQ